MKNFFYHIKQALSEFRVRPGSHIFTVGTVSLALVLAGSVFLISKVLNYASHTWGSGAQVAVYLEKEIPPAKIASVKRRIAELPGVHSITVISPARARKRLVSNLKKDAPLITGVEAGFFPTSLEVIIRGDTARVEKTQKSLAKLNGIVAGITDVRGVHTWNKKIGYIIEIMLLLGVILLAIVIFASGYVIMSGARLSMEAKIEELKVIKFLGASPSFIQTPLLVSGMLQGLMGAVVAFGLLYGLAHFTFPLITALVGSALVGTDKLVFFTPIQLLSGLGIAAFTGLIASKLALSTIKV